MTALDDALAPYGMRPHARRTGIGCKSEWFTPPPLEPLEAILVDDSRPLRERHPEYFDPPIRCSLYTWPDDWADGTAPDDADVIAARKRAREPRHHGYDAIVTIAVMPLPPQPEIGNGDHEAWRRYILAMERRGHARALLDGICEGVWEQ